VQGMHAAFILRASSRRTLWADGVFNQRFNSAVEREGVPKASESVWMEAKVA
jgi:hypothetical protein